MEIRTRIIYDYGRSNFEQELQELSPETPAPTDAEWVTIQAQLQEDISAVADAFALKYIATHIGNHIKSKED